MTDVDLKASDIIVSSTRSSTRRRYLTVHLQPWGRWNREAFKLLSRLFQMTITEVPRAGVPSITIAK